MKTLQQAMFDLYKRTVKEARVRPTRFKNAITECEDDTAVAAFVKRLIRDEHPANGYADLFPDFLHLTIEAFVVETTEFRDFFNEGDIQRAADRLRKNGYRPRIPAMA
jgi:hypothetical protein